MSATPSSCRRSKSMMAGDTTNHHTPSIALKLIEPLISIARRHQRSREFYNLGRHRNTQPASPPRDFMALSISLVAYGRSNGPLSLAGPAVEPASCRCPRGPHSQTAVESNPFDSTAYGAYAPFSRHLLPQSVCSDATWNSRTMFYRRHGKTSRPGDSCSRPT